MGKIETVYSEDIFSGMPFIDMAQRFADLPGTVVLASGGDLDCSQYHILAARPWLCFTARKEETIICLENGAGEKSLASRENPLSLIGDIVRYFAIDPGGAAMPVAAGLFGYLSYDLKDYIEKLPRTSVDDLNLPLACLYAPSILVVCDKSSGKCRLHLPKIKSLGEKGVKQARDWFFSVIKSPAPVQKTFFGGSAGFASPFDRDSYMAAVEKIKNYIAAGHIYQVNLSQRFETDFSGQPFALFAALFAAAPAPFFSYVNAGDHHVVSTSMERFLKVRGSMVEARPIKGTRPRGETPEKDNEMKQALAESKKDDAELSMIVDLMRNDLGRVCERGSVRVTEHKRLEAYKNVFHLVSVIKGKLAHGANIVDLLYAAFPSGSITGCPRIRAMEIIDELEPTRRHIYTGSVGYIGFHDTMDLSIAIRTATIYKGRLYFSVGGGVVQDSDPGDEYEETLHKGRAVMDIFKGRGKKAAPCCFVWQNGLVVKEEKAMVPFFDKGAAYGYGFFETIRVKDGKPEFLEAHLERFYKTWDALFETHRPDLSFEEIISRVLIANRLTNGLAAIKITATFGTGETVRYDHGIWVSARPYIHRLDTIKKPGLDLASFPHPRQSPLADHKTLNYLFYFLANKWAKKRGADEALIINPDGTISETGTGNILMVKGKRVIRPESPHVLPGIMEGRIVEILSGMGYTIYSKPVMRRELDMDWAVIVTNSLMGPAPVLSVDGSPTADAGPLCRELSKKLP
ncbi:MAG: aminodeoxychorismate synthase component I [Deltaproteobacteria bacterium]|nr:aminodeoxychorismate synthase component I [Deltaproteobacteria bacterium]